MAEIYYAIRTSDLALKRPYRITRFDRIEPIIFKTIKEAVKYLVEEYDAKNMFDENPCEYEFCLKANYIDRNEFEHELKFRIERVFIKGEDNV